MRRKAAIIGRRGWLASCCVSVAALVSGRVHGQTFTPNNSAERLSQTNRVQLEEQLQVGLRTTLPAQKAFITTVVNAVHTGQISQSMVNLVYKWAKQKNEKIPFPYFQFAMRALAKRRGVVLP